MSSWHRELVELAALFLAVAIADLWANTLVHDQVGPVVLIGLGVLLVGSALVHRAWKSHARRVRSGSDVFPGPASGVEVWRVRTTVRDTPGSLAALTASLAGHGFDIASVQVHGIPDGAVDEFLVRVPAGTTAADLIAATEAGSGRDTRVEAADVHDLVDIPTSALALAARAAEPDADRGPLMRSLLGECRVRWSFARTNDTEPGSIDEPDRTTMRLRDPLGGTLTIQRDSFPFTPGEFARARALLDLELRLSERVHPDSSVLLLPNGTELTIRQADADDATRITEMHARCSSESRRRRYFAEISRPSERELRRMLHKRYGHTLIAVTSVGAVVGMANLMWEREHAEVALLVEDAWQRRGIGTALLRRLTTSVSTTKSVYAVTETANTPMIRTLRRVGARDGSTEPGFVHLVLDPST